MAVWTWAEAEAVKKRARTVGGSRNTRDLRYESDEGDCFGRFHGCSHCQLCASPGCQSASTPHWHNPSICSHRSPPVRCLMCPPRRTRRSHRATSAAPDALQEDVCDRTRRRSERLS